MYEKTPKKQIYTALESLSLEELENLLKQGFNSDEELDTDYTMAILEVIERQETENSDYKPFDIKAGWNDFEKNYMGKKSEYLHLAPPNDILESTPDVPEKTRHRKRRPKRMLAVAAVMVVLLGTLTAQAFGYPIFQSVARWTSGIFTVGGTPVENRPGTDITIELPLGKEYSSIQEVLDDIGVTFPIVPTWHPDGFVQTQMAVIPFPEMLKLHAYFENTELSFSIFIVVHITQLDGVALFHEIDDDSVFKYETGGIVHYIMSNYERAVVVWVNENVEASIQGDITEEDLHRMLNSIYGG